MSRTMTKEEYEKSNAALKSVEMHIGAMDDIKGESDAFAERQKRHLDLAGRHARETASYDANDGLVGLRNGHVLAAAREDRALALASLRAALRDGEQLLILRQRWLDTLRRAIAALEVVL